MVNINNNKPLRPILLALVLIAGTFCPTIAASGNADTLTVQSEKDRAGNPAAQSATSDNLAHAVVHFVVNAPIERVWSSLTDFPNYPHIFSKIKTCHITKKQGDLVWVESDLKPHMFVHKATNYTLNDLKGKPYLLDWRLLDGNFESLRGKWELAATDNGSHCQVTYTLELNAGPVIPGFLIAYFLRTVQKRIILELKNWVESDRPAESNHISLKSSASIKTI